MRLRKSAAAFASSLVVAAGSATLESQIVQHRAIAFGPHTYAQDSRTAPLAVLPSTQRTIPNAQERPASRDVIGLIPILPFITEYEHGKQYYVEKISDHPVFIGIEAIIQDGPRPVYQVVMTEKEGHRRLYYTNSEAKAKLLEASGKTVFVTAIEHRIEESLGEEPKYIIAFKDEKSRAIKWTFTQVDELDDHSKGVALIGRPFKVLFREMASMAGEGTLVEIGDKISQPRQLPDLSSPPDLLVYEATLCIGTTIGGIVPGSQTWQTNAPHGAIDLGTEWTLTDGGKNKRHLKVISRDGDEFTIQEIETDPSVSAAVTLVMKQTSDGLSLRSFAYSDGQGVLRFKFAPALDIAAVLRSGKKSTGSFQIDIGAATGAVQGEIEAERKGNAVEVTGRPISPDWAKNLLLKSQITPTGTGYRIDSERM